MVVHPAGLRLRDMYDGHHGEVIGLSEGGAIRVRLDVDGDDRVGYLGFHPDRLEREPKSHG